MQVKQQIGSGWLVLLGCSGIFFVVVVAGDYLLQVVQPEAIANMAVRQFDPGGDSTSVRFYEHLKNMLLGVEGGILVVAGVLLLVPPFWKWLASAVKSQESDDRKCNKNLCDTQPMDSGSHRSERRKKMTRLFSVLIVATLLGTTGCKPYNVPEWEKHHSPGQGNTSFTSVAVALGNVGNGSSAEREILSSGGVLPRPKQPEA